MSGKSWGRFESSFILIRFSGCATGIFSPSTVRKRRLGISGCRTDLRQRPLPLLPRQDAPIDQIPDFFRRRLGVLLPEVCLLEPKTQIDQLYRPGKIILKHLFSHRLIHITSPNLPRTWVLSFAIDPFLTKYECRCTTCC